ncbi:unnamed protein product [Soboliphyme baturini]|uniref:CNH domain-containing protein n=1 Tax=Soboliphyme baturini TaxID=241478 RepID=A0A183J355_9BILA|nr:unnamed protein product [Soboliphyme baturini]
MRILRIWFQFIAVQTGPFKIMVYNCNAGTTSECMFDIDVRSVFITGQYLLCCCGSMLIIKEILNPDDFSQIASINVSSSVFAAEKHKVFVGLPKKVLQYTFQGEVKQELPLNDLDGSLFSMDYNNGFLLVTTNTGHFRIYKTANKYVVVFSWKDVPAYKFGRRNAIREFVQQILLMK